jgi:hypothetical protein
MCEETQMVSVLNHYVLSPWGYGSYETLALSGSPNTGS